MEAPMLPVAVVADAMGTVERLWPEIVAGLEPCKVKGSPHFIRINPTINNPIGDRVPCPVCYGAD